MKKILLIAFLFFCDRSFSQTGLSWYKIFKGKIDKYPATLHIHKAGHNYSGYYYYDLHQKPIYFIGDDTTLKGKIQLLGFAGPTENEYFEFSLNGADIAGNWKKTYESKPLIFSAIEVKPALVFTYVYTTGSEKLRPRWKESPQASYSAASVWPAEKTPSAEFIKSVIRKNFTKQMTPDEIGAVLLKLKKVFLESYISDNKELADADLKDVGPGYNLEEDDKTLIAYQSAKIITLAMFTYAYTGGAHGNYSTSYKSMDLTKNKIISLDDVITLQGKNTLRSLLEKNFRQQYHLKSTEALSEGGLFENKIEPNDNFYITGKGIGFGYAPYEIGPYAMGEINIFIPFTELKMYLKDQFKKLLE